MTKIEQKIPEGWSVKKVNDIGRVITGSTPPMSCSENYGGTFCWATAQDFKGKYITDTVVKLSSKGKELSRILPVGSVLVTCIASIGLNAIAKIEMATNQQINAIIVNKNNNNEFVYYQICQNVNVLRKYAGAGGMLILPKGEFEKIPFTFPPLPEQEKIARILSCWDDGIEKLSALIEKKKIQKKALMQQLLKKIKTTNMKRFDEIFKDYSIKNQPCEKLLSATQDRGVLPRDMLQGRVMSPEGSLAGYKLVNIGDFVISLRSFQGGFEYSNYKGIISPAYTVLKNIINIDKQFYRHFFKSYEFIEKYLSIAVVGIRDGKQISYQDLCSVKIPYPDLAKQKAIAEILSKADEEIELLNKKLEAFKQEKKALMQQLLTGKIRVKVN